MSSLRILVTTCLVGLGLVTLGPDELAARPHGGSGGSSHGHGSHHRHHRTHHRHRHAHGHKHHGAKNQHVNHKGKNNPKGKKNRTPRQMRALRAMRDAPGVNSQQQQALNNALSGNALSADDRAALTSLLTDGRGSG
jgi:hypothetical protein